MSLHHNTRAIAPPLKLNPSFHARLLLIGIASTALAALPAGAQSRTSAVPITLRQVVDSVIARHPLVEAARARVRATRGARTTAGAFGNPVLSYNVENAPLPGRQAPPMDRETMTTAMLPLEPLYQRAPRVRRANAEIRAAEADANAERQRVALDAARAFYSTAVAQVGLDAALDLASWLDTIVAYNRTRVDEGVAAEADLIRSELERDRSTADATMQEADLARARAELSAFLGQTPPVLSALVVAIDDVPLSLPTQAGDTMSLPIIARALDARPEVRAARERLSAAGADVATERSMFVRMLGVMFGTKQSVGSTSMVAGVSMPFPLFDQNRGEVARASAEREAVAFELAAQERAVRAQVTGAFEAAKLLTARAGVLSQSSHGYLARADEARRIALGAYREGAVPLLQVIDAARAWGEARVAYYGMLYAQHEGVLELIVAQGADIAAALPSLDRSGDTTGSGNRPR